MRYADILIGLSSKSAEQKSVALEAFAFYLARLLAMKPVRWRFQGDKAEAGRAVLMLEGDYLAFGRWQVLYKSGEDVTHNDIAVEVGLSVCSKPDVLLILATDHLTKDAETFAREAMRSTRLDIIMFEQEDFVVLLNSPNAPEIVMDMLNEKLQQVRSARKEEQFLWS